MSKEVYHSIFYQTDGGPLAHEIKDFFATKRYSIQFNLHKLQGLDTRKNIFSGVSILLITPESLDIIQSRRDLDLNKLFPNPDYSVALLFRVGKSPDEISRILSSRVKNSHRWSLLEYRLGTGLSNIGIHIMEIVENIECICGTTASVRQFQVWPPHIKPNQHVILIFDKPVDQDTEVNVFQEWDETKQEAQRLNCMTYSFNIGDTKPGENVLEVLVNNVSYGKALLLVDFEEPKVDQINGLLQSVINPMELICQCLHVVPENRKDLDIELGDLLSAEKNSVSDMFDHNFGDSHSKSVLPTLLHFGAKYGLTRFCKQLITLPVRHKSLKMKNKDGLIPRDLAAGGGFNDLAVFLQKTEVPPTSESETKSLSSANQNSVDQERERFTQTDGISQTGSFRGSSSSHSYRLVPERQGNTLGGNPFSEMLDTDVGIDYTNQNSQDYSTRSRRMTDVTGNMGNRSYLTRKPSLPVLGTIKKKEHPYDLPSDTP